MTFNALPQPDIDAAKRVMRETGYDCAIGMTRNPDDCVLLVKLAKNKVKRFHGPTWDETAQRVIDELGKNEVVIEKGVMTIKRDNVVVNKLPYNRKMRRAMAAKQRRG